MDINLPPQLFFYLSATIQALLATITSICFERSQRCPLHHPHRHRPLPTLPHCRRYLSVLPPSHGLLHSPQRTLLNPSTLIPVVAIILHVLANGYMKGNIRSFGSWALEPLLLFGSPEISCTYEVFCHCFPSQIFVLSLVPQLHC